MKVGFVTDTHLGLRDDETTIQTLNMLADEFHERGVETVVHLGDVAHEEPEDLYVERVRSIADVFDDFEYHMTLGNHDVQGLTPETFAKVFDESLVEVIARENGTSLVKMNTAALVETTQTAEPTPAGVIPDVGLSQIMSELEDGQEVLVCTHYPLQYTQFYQEQPFFNVRPEYVFPINKLQFEATLFEADVEPNIQVFCGHLHPDHRKTVQTEPLGIDVNVMEAVQLFEMDNGEIVWDDNTEVDVEDLIIEF